MACWAKYETKFSMKQVVPCWSLSATYSAKTGNAERWDKPFPRYLACLVTLSWELCVGFDRLCHYNLLHAVIGYKKQTFSLAMFLIKFFNFETEALPAYKISKFSLFCGEKHISMCNQMVTSEIRE